MHFRGLLENPTDPMLVVFKKQQENFADVTAEFTAGGSIGSASQHMPRGNYLNDQYVNATENSTRFNDFMKKIGVDGKTYNPAMINTFQSGG